MTSTPTQHGARAHSGADIFDGEKLHFGAVLLVDRGFVQGIVDPRDVPKDSTKVRYDGGTLMPGFVDLQVNGGGGVQFNDHPSVDALDVIAKAHWARGTRALLPTLITDTSERVRMAVDAVAQAVSAGIPGIFGLHLEGPHLSIARKGAHDGMLIRPMEQHDLDFLLSAAKRVPNLKVTVAPESVSNAQIRAMAHAGIIVSLGHTDCDFDTARAAFGAGARCVTHLFNAMSQLGSREPGLVGAALATPNIAAGLIADGIHVHSAALTIAMRAMDEIFLVTDAMAPFGSDMTEFRLGDRRVMRQNGRLTLQDGTLAGADLHLPQALKIALNTGVLTKDRALAMVTSKPGCLFRTRMGAGQLLGVPAATVVHLSDDFTVSAVD